MSEKWEIERERSLVTYYYYYISFADSLTLVVHGGYPLTLRLLDRFEFFGVSLSLFYKAAMMITFDPIDEFIDSPK
jgi:hypothetical protein